MDAPRQYTADSTNADRIPLASMVDPPSWVSLTVFAVLGLALVFAIARLLRGPSLPDRVVALDLCAYILIGFAATTAIMTNHPAIINVALGVGLFAFLGTIAFARYIEQTHVSREADA